MERFQWSKEGKRNIMSERTASIWQADAFYDADDQDASGVLHAVADRILHLAPNQTLEIRAIDPGVTAALTSWCCLTGHALVMHAGERYLLRHK
jgi:TusA-related sulfurtransferase